jgi:hypothetical protein
VGFTVRDSITAITGFGMFQSADLVLYLMKVPFTVVRKNPYLLLNEQMNRGPIEHLLSPIPRGA